MHYVRRTVQWFFLRLEKLFNLVFGDRLNPLELPAGKVGRDKVYVGHIHS